MQGKYEQANLTLQTLQKVMTGIAKGNSRWTQQNHNNTNFSVMDSAFSTVEGETM
jgi:hypothetical protein